LANQVGQTLPVSTQAACVQLVAA